MSRLFYFCTAVFFAMSITHAQNIEGKWAGQMQGPNGAFDLTFNFHTAGDSLTGTVTSQMGEIPISNGKVNDTTVTFDVNLNDMTIHHECKVTSDSTISMKVKGMQGEPIEIILNRLPGVKDELK